MLSHPQRLCFAARHFVAPANNRVMLRSTAMSRRSMSMSAAATTAAAAKRPVSPHLSVYRYQLTWTMSIAHRVSGCGLAGGVYGAGIWYALAPFASSSVVATVGSMPAVLLFAGKLIASTPFTYHTFNGIRHLLWDVGYGLSLKGVYMGGYATAAATAASSIYLALL